MVLGSRLNAGEQQWSEPFLMVDRPGFPDCNTCMMIDAQERLWLFWPTILANTWESCLTNYAVSDDYAGPGAPKWTKEAVILLKPADFGDQAEKGLDKFMANLKNPLTRAKRKVLPPRGSSCMTNCINDWAGNRAVNRPSCPAAAFCCRSIAIRFHFR